MPVCLLTITSTITANEYSAHVHGHAELTIAMEQNSIELNLIAPAESLLGFEHKAATPDEVSQVAELKKHLSQHANVIQFNGGNCQVKSVNVDASDVISNGHHIHKHSSANSHAELTVNYQFSCFKASDVASATVRLFEHYMALEKIKVMWLTAFQQGSIELDKKNIRVTFH